MKHVEMDCYFVRERVHSEDVKIVAIKSKFQTTNIFNKAHGADWFKSFRGK